MSLTELEIRIAHIERTLQTLGDELTVQQRRQRTLEAELDALRERLASASEPVPGADDAPPPHY